MSRLLVFLVLPLASAPAWSADAFPWSGEVTLTDKAGQKLTWVVRRADGEVHITGAHPKWQVTHRARPDGTPIATERKSGGEVTRITYTPEGAQVEHVDAKGKAAVVTVKQAGLWDGDTLDARLAGLPWGKGKKVRMKIVDSGAGDGTVYPMVAEYVGEEDCGGLACHHVHLALDDFRRMFAPSFEYRYAREGGRFLQHAGDGLDFAAR